MSSTKATSVNYSVKPFFGFILRQNWQHLALYVILALLVMFVPCLIQFSEGIPDFHGYDTAQKYVLAQLQDINTIGIFLSAGIAILSGMSAVGYINNKSHVGCWHSFPVSRTKIYLIETSARAIYYGIAILVGFAAAYGIAGVFLGFAVEGFFIALLMGLMQSVCCYLVVCSVTLLAGGLCGTAIMRLIMLCIISFLPIALYALLVYLSAEGMKLGQDSNLWESFYFKDSFTEVICLPYRVIQFVGIGGTHSPMWSLLLLPEAALYYAGGFLLHKYRKSEATGTTIVWKPVFAAVKYVILFTCGLFGMFILGSDYVSGDNSLLRIILGTIMGLVIAFIIMNAILYRSSKAMFRGMKPFLICAAVTFAFVLLVPVNITGLVGRDYSPSSMKKLVIGDYALTYTDQEEIETLMTLLEENERVDLPTQSSVLTMESDPAYLKQWFREASNEENWDSKYTDTGLVRDLYYTNWTTSVKIIEYPKFGIPLAKFVEIDQNGEFWQTVRLSREYLETYDPTQLTPEDIREIQISYGENTLNLYCQSDREVKEFFVEYSGNEAVMVEEYKNTTIGVNEAAVNYAASNWHEPVQRILSHTRLRDGFANTPIVGQIRFYVYEDNGGVRSYSYPIFADDIALINEISRQHNEVREDYGMYSISAVNTVEDVLAYLTPEFSTRAVLVNYETGEAKKLTVDELRDLLADAVSVERGSRWGAADHAVMSTVPYGIYISRGGEASQKELRFRENAVTETELDALFASLKS